MKHLRLRMGLRGQLVLLFLLVSLIPLLIVAFLAHGAGTRGLRGIIKKSLVEQAEERLYLADRVIKDQLRSFRRLPLRNISAQVAPTNSDNRLPTLKGAYEDLLNSITYLERRVGENSQIIITNRHQQVIFATDDQLLFQQIDKPWWRTAYNNGLGYELISDVQHDTETQQYALPITLPIPGPPPESKAIGVLRIVAPLPKLSEVVNSEKEGEEICLFDKHGQIICAPPDSGYRFSERIEMTTAAMAAINAGDNKYVGFDMKGETDARGEKRIFGWARTKRWEPREPEGQDVTNRRRTEPPLDSQNFSNWRVLVSRPTSLAYSEVTKLTKRILSFTLISCLVVIAIALVVSQRIVTPIRQVTGAARAIGRGEFDQEIKVTGSNEVGILAEEFNSMRWNLKSAVEKLTQEEKKMTAIVNSIAEGLILVDSDNRVLHINPAAERLLGLSEDSIDKDITELIQNDELIQIEQTPSKNEEANFVSEITLIHHDEKLVLRTIASPFLDENGQTLGTVYLFDDITREKEIDQMKSDFISLVSHELRTPLTSIIGFVSFILDGKAGAINDRQRNSLARVQRQSKRLAALINDLLDISRIESGRIQMEQEPISLLEIVTQRIEEIRPQADEKSIRLDLTAPESVPTIFGDEARMGQVFTNLIGNAIKFTPNNGEVSIKVRVDGSLLHVEVIDTGPGIPAEERQKVFDKFYQLSDISTRQQGGSGLGLSITKSIVEAHGGKLWIDDGNQGKGSNFQFVLPLVREDDNVKDKERVRERYNND
jgi:PAS domain S-box-containing protein